MPDTATLTEPPALRRRCAVEVAVLLLLVYLPRWVSELIPGPQITTAHLWVSVAASSLFGLQMAAGTLFIIGISEEGWRGFGFHRFHGPYDLVLGFGFGTLTWLVSQLGMPARWSSALAHSPDLSRVPILLAYSIPIFAEQVVMAVLVVRLSGLLRSTAIAVILVSGLVGLAYLRQYPGQVGLAFAMPLLCTGFFAATRRLAPIFIGTGLYLLSWGLLSA